MRTLAPVDLLRGGFGNTAAGVQHDIWISCPIGSRQFLCIVFAGPETQVD